jgi:hypothetical protein
VAGELRGGPPVSVGLSAHQTVSHPTHSGTRYPKRSMIPGSRSADPVPLMPPFSDAAHPVGA